MHGADEEGQGREWDRWGPKGIKKIQRNNVPVRIIDHRLCFGSFPNL